MKFFKLSLMNLKQNIKNYGMYIFSMVFSIVIFYNFITIIFSEQFKNLQSLNVVVSIAGVCAMVLSIFFIFFISYSSSFFIEQRKKEFGIYTFMGVENNKIALLFAQEGLLIGLIALIGGVVGGLLTNKLFLMALTKVSNVSTVIKFEISIPAIISTSVMFVVILIGVFIKEYLILVKTDISKLINATNLYQSDNSKNKTLQGILGLIIILLAYVVILYYKKFNIPFPISIMTTVIMVIIGTMLLFKGFFTFVVSKLINNKKFLYKGTNVLSYNNIIFRIRDNNKVLGQIAVLITCCLTSIIVSVTTKSLFVQGKESEYPYSLTYSENQNNDIVEKAINLNNEKIDYKINTQVIPYELKSSPIPFMSDIDIIKYSDVENIAKYRDLDNEKKLIKTKLEGNEGIFVIPKNFINSFNFNVELNIGKDKIKVIDSYALNLFGRFRGDKPVLIVNDNTYNKLSNNLDNSISITSIALKNFDNTAKIASYVKDNSNLELYSVDNFKSEDYNFINAIYFIGLFLALVFVVSIGSIMYFKCISDASKDKPRFETLRNIGASQEYINKSIFKQVGIFFLLPSIIAIIHSIVSGYAITSLFNQDGRLLTLGTILVFLIIYITYYIITAKKYIQLTK